MNKLTTFQYRYVLYGVLILVFIISLIIFLRVLLVSNYLDFSFYYQALISYTKAQNPYFNNFLYPPPAILFLLPFTIFPLFIAAKIFTLVSILCLFISVFILFRLFKIPYYSPQSILFLILVCSYFPAKYTLANGQINTLILLFVVLFINWFVKKRDTFAGAIFAISVILKLFPLFILPYLFIIKRYSLLKSFFFTLLVISFIVLIVIPFPVIFAYFNSLLPILFHEGGGTYYFDQSLSAFLARSINSYIAVQITKPLSLLILLFTYVILWKRRHNNNIELLSISVLLILNILLGNFAWQHHFIWLIVPYIITFIYIKENQSPKKFYIILLISYLLTAANIPNPRLIPPIIQSHVFYGAVILYFMLLYFLIKVPKTIQLQKNKLRIKNKLKPKYKKKV